MLLSEILSAGQADSISDHGPASAVHRDLNMASESKPSSTYSQWTRPRSPLPRVAIRLPSPGYPEGISRTFRSARIRVSYRDTATAATSDQPVDWVKLGAAASATPRWAIRPRTPAKAAGTSSSVMSPPTSTRTSAVALRKRARSRDAARGPERNEHLHQVDPDLRVG